MDYNLLENIQYCKEIVDSLLSFLYYTHIPPAVISLLLGTYVLVKNHKNVSARFLFALCIVFALWTMADLGIWLTYDQATPMMFLWSLIGMLSTLLFVLTFLFTYTFVTGRAAPRLMTLSWIVLSLPVIFASATSFNLGSFDAVDCVATEETWYLYYYHGIGLLAAILLPFIPLMREKNKAAGSERIPRSAVMFAIIGAELFLLTFLTTSFLASYLVEAGIVPDFGLEQYGIAAMAVFMAFLGYLIVQYRAFNLKLLGASALVLALLILIGSEFLFVKDVIGIWLVALTFVLALFFGFLLVDGVKREIRQREHIEKLLKELEKSNAQQVTLIHFITHQIKGFLAKSRNIFAGMREGDYGVMPESMNDIVRMGFESDTKGVETVQEILGAANIKSGKVTYKMAPFDLKQLIDEIVALLKPAADAKKLEFTESADDGSFIIPGDRGQLVNAFKNLIDNSIKYTPSGKVAVSLAHASDKVVFKIEDTGVGITPEDMNNLFTEGGHGKESQKINTDSTGFGLYIVKNIVEAHNGRVWAESDGAGKGSRFIVELPAK